MEPVSASIEFQLLKLTRWRKESADHVEGLAMRKARIRKPTQTEASNGFQAGQWNLQIKPSRALKKNTNTDSQKREISGKVPSGDVRMTANIRSDLHIKLKIAAAERRTTIGELIEELIERHL